MARAARPPAPGVRVAEGGGIPRRPGSFRRHRGPCLVRGPWREPRRDHPPSLRGVGAAADAGDPRGDPGAPAHRVEPGRAPAADAGTVRLLLRGAPPRDLRGPGSVAPPLGGHRGPDRPALHHGGLRRIRAARAPRRDLDQRHGPAARGAALAAASPDRLPRRRRRGDPLLVAGEGGTSASLSSTRRCSPSSSSSASRRSFPFLRSVPARLRRPPTPG